MSAVTHRTIDYVLRELVQFLDSFAMDIDFSGFAEDSSQARLIDFARNDLRCNDETREESCEIACGAGMKARFIKNVLLNRGDRTHRSLP
jgi:hypothetical protein